MNRLAGIPTCALLLHPLASANHELALSPYHPSQVEYCRYHEPSGRSVHLQSDLASNSIILAISPSHPPGGPLWRIYIHTDLWISSELERTAEGLETLFEVQPLDWCSWVHQELIEQWAIEKGVRATAVPGIPWSIFLSKWI